VDCEVRFLPSGERVRVARGATLLDATRRAGLPVARACGGAGLCSRCGVQVLSGPVSGESAREVRAKRANRVDPELRLACLARPEGDVVVTAAYW
jgi:ferredoxin